MASSLSVGGVNGTGCVVFEIKGVPGTWRACLMVIWYNKAYLHV